jgi:hypothetical protein
VGLDYLAEVVEGVATVAVEDIGDDIGWTVVGVVNRRREGDVGTHLDDTVADRHTAEEAPADDLRYSAVARSVS